MWLSDSGCSTRKKRENAVFLRYKGTKKKKKKMQKTQLHLFFFFT